MSKLFSAAAAVMLFVFVFASSALTAEQVRSDAKAAKAEFTATVVGGAAGALFGTGFGMMTGPAAPVVTPIASIIGAAIGMLAASEMHDEAMKQLKDNRSTQVDDGFRFYHSEIWDERKELQDLLEKIFRNLEEPEAWKSDPDQKEEKDEGSDEEAVVFAPVPSCTCPPMVPCLCNVRDRCDQPLESWAMIGQELDGLLPCPSSENPTDDRWLPSENPENPENPTDDRWLPYWVENSIHDMMGTAYSAMTGPTTDSVAAETGVYHIELNTWIPVDHQDAPYLYLSNEELLWNSTMGIYSPEQNPQGHRGGNGG